MMETCCRSRSPGSPVFLEFRKRQLLACIAGSLDEIEVLMRRKYPDHKSAWEDLLVDTNDLESVLAQQEEVGMQRAMLPVALGNLGSTPTAHPD